MKRATLKPFLSGFIIALACLIHPVTAQADDIQIIKERLIEDALVREGFMDRVKRFSDARESETPTYLASLQADGSWPDVNYLHRENNWSPLKHLGRMLAITLAYAKPDSPYHQDEQLLERIIASLNFWYQANPTCKNWYKNDLGKQFFLQQIGLLLSEKLPEELHSKIVNDLSAEPRMGGVNMTWFAVSTIYRGVLENSPERIQSGLAGFSSQVAFNTRYEGLKPDFSYQQHGRHLYNGMYGTNWLSDTARIAHALRDTKFSLTDDQVSLLRSFYLESMRWSLRGPLQDYNVRGRQVGRTAGVDMQAYELLKPLDYLSELDPEYSAAYLESKAAIEKGIPQAIEGNRHFWWADFTVHHRPNYMVSLKMCSQRTLGTEIDVNKENLLGYWLPFGFTYLYRTGREYEDIFPAWDWGRLPGVTSPHEEFAIKKGRYTQQTIFVGAVSDGRYGVSSMHLDAQQTQAQKSWFFFEDEWVALGSDIQSTHSAPIVSSVNQELLKGEVHVDGHRFNGGQQSLSNPNWVLHNGVGYIFPGKQNVTLKAESQSGRFKRIYGLADDVTVTKDVFSLWFEHGEQPTGANYAYIVVPSTNLKDIKRRTRDPKIRILANTETQQAVSQDELGLIGVVFHEKGTLEISDISTVSVSEPSILLIDMKSETLHINDPTQKLTQVTIRLERANAPAFEKAVPLPTGNNAGTSVRVQLP